MLYKRSIYFQGDAYETSILTSDLRVAFFAYRLRNKLKQHNEQPRRRQQFMHSFVAGRYLHNPQNLHQMSKNIGNSIRSYNR